MATRSKVKQTTAPTKSDNAKAASSHPRMGMETTMGELARLLDAEDFSDLDEAKAFLAGLLGADLTTRAGAPGPASASYEAQQLAYQAMDARDPAKAKKLAKRALVKDPDCVDALIVLTSIEASSPKQAIVGLQRAIAAGERSLGPAFFEENKGDFWGLLETRPYMRARQELAEMYVEVGLVQDAIAHYAAMLELNPNDNQGVREPLLGLYLQTGDLDAARKLFERYERESSAVYAWGRVLERYLADDLQAASALLKTARHENRFVELYLTGQLERPTELPDSYALGSKEEAILSLNILLPAWVEHPESMFWLLELLLTLEPEKTARQRRLGKRSQLR